MPKRLVLGTVQLGIPYGINNRIGKPSLDEARAIIAEAWQNGIVEFDTAQAYGASEEILGRVFLDIGIASDARVISKLDLNLDLKNIEALDESLSVSLDRLKVDRLAGLMLHHESQMDSWDYGLSDWFIRQQENGMVESVGVSVYTPEKAFQALGKKNVQFIQIPYNILDRRFEDAGVFHYAEKFGKNIYIRSVFLQGLILMDSSELPLSMAFAGDVLRRVGELAAEFRLTRAQLALGYVRSQWPEASLVLGAETPNQVRENAKLYDLCLDLSMCNRIRHEFSRVDEKILNPSQWYK